MREFSITIRSFQELQEFVSLATVQPFEVFVENDRQQISGKSFMGMFSLDLSRPMRVVFTCNDEQYAHFRQCAARFCV